MSNTMDQANRIRITTFVEGKYGDKFIDARAEIEKIVRLVRGKAEEFPYFVDSPELAMFRIEFYSDEQLLERIGVTGDFIHRDNEWYLMRDSSLTEELNRYTGDVHFSQMPSCTFGSLKD